MSYVYPFSERKTTTREDQGQDFGGEGAVLAIGNAKIISASHPSGWPGSGGILYQLLDGPARGKFVYVYEGVAAKVRAGQFVKAGQAIGSVIPGTSTGIEMGWADAAGQPLAHAEYDGVHATKVGTAFGKFLSSLSGGGSSGGGGNILEQGFGAIAGAYNSAVTEPIIHGGEAVLGVAGEAAASVGEEVVAYIAKLIASKAGPLLLNVALVGGGAYMIYYGIALAAGTQQPAKRLAEATAGAVGGPPAAAAVAE